MFEIKLIFYGLSCMLQFSEFVRALSYSLWDVFNIFLLIDATDRSKIISDQKRFFIALSLYPLSFFANTPFNLFLQGMTNMEYWIGIKLIRRLSLKLQKIILEFLKNIYPCTVRKHMQLLCSLCQHEEYVGAILSN